MLESLELKTWGEPMIIVDSREPPKISQIFTILGHEHAVEELPVGDILFDEKFIVERKTLGDFWSSIKDGRLDSQAERMQHYDKAVIILSGDWKTLKPSQLNPIYGKIASLYARWNIPVFCTRNDTDLVSFAIRLYTKFTDGKTVSRNMIVKKAYTSKDVKIAMLSTIDGIGTKKAEAALETYGGDIISLFNDVKFHPETIGKLLPKKSTKILTEVLNIW